MGKMKDVALYAEDFELGYMGCLFWTDEAYAQELVCESGRSWEDFEWSSDSLTVDAKTRIREVVEEFVTANWEDLSEYMRRGRPADLAGHDFALSQNGHGTGFWDRGYGDLGDRLHKAAKAHGEASLMPNADGTVDYEG